MYEIYINDRPLRLTSTPAALQSPPVDRHHLLARYSGKAKTLLQYIDMMEKGSQRVAAVTLHAQNLDRLWEDFYQQYKIVAAAGGLVRLRGTEKLLFIYRRDHLDLPKGKIDKGESSAEAALREVREETGMEELELVTGGENGSEPDHTTWHTYRNRKGKRILKPTYWYKMITSQEEIIPQTEEDIEWGRFLSLEEALQQREWPLYESLRSMLENV